MVLSKYHMPFLISLLFGGLLLGSHPAMPVEASQTVSMVFAGDIMLDRNVYIASMADHKNFEHPFLLIAPELAKYDVRVANLEGPITDTSFNMKRAMAMSFTFNPKFAPAIAKYFDIVSLANNHTYNFGEAGLQSTKKYLHDAGEEYFADPLNREGYTTRVIEKNGFKIALLGYHAFAGPEQKNIPTIVAAIKDARTRADFVIVMPHWGVEYAARPSPAQVKAGHAFIDAGADAVIGGHPHVVEPRETYKGKPIFYSLGNFIFDQNFSARTMSGEMVNLQLSRAIDGSVAAQFIPIPFKINKASQPYMPAPKP